MKKVLRIGTRKSPLALWQARHVQTRLQRAHPGLDVVIVRIMTAGDIMQNVPLADHGGKGLFLKELETALLEKRIAVAVHSMKDVTVHLPDELHIAAICQRADAHDALLSRHDGSLTDLPTGAVIGTCSSRRKAQLLNARADLIVRDVRGNVQTRIARLANGDFDAIVLAVAGLRRLGLEEKISCVLPMSLCLPAAGQGAIGLETRTDDHETQYLLRVLHHAPTHDAVTAERAFNRALNCNCHMPVASHAIYSDAHHDAPGDTSSDAQHNDAHNNTAGNMHLTAMVATTDGKQLMRADMHSDDIPSASQNISAAEHLGASLGEQLLSQGAAQLLPITPPANTSAP